jgi:hypothetical protein
MIWLLSLAAAGTSIERDVTVGMTGERATQTSVCDGDRCVDRSGPVGVFPAMTRISDLRTGEVWYVNHDARVFAAAAGYEGGDRIFWAELWDDGTPVTTRAVGTNRFVIANGSRSVEVTVDPASVRTAADFAASLRSRYPDDHRLVDAFGALPGYPVQLTYGLDTGVVIRVTRQAVVDVDPAQLVVPSEYHEIQPLDLILGRVPPEPDPARGPDEPAWVDVAYDSPDVYAADDNGLWVCSLEECYHTLPDCTVGPPVAMPCPPSALSPAGRYAVAVCDGRVATVELASGAVVWTAGVANAVDAAVDDAGVLTLAAGRKRLEVRRGGDLVATVRSLPTLSPGPVAAWTWDAKVELTAHGVVLPAGPWRTAQPTRDGVWFLGDRGAARVTAEGVTVHPAGPKGPGTQGAWGADGLIVDVRSPSGERWLELVDGALAVQHTFPLPGEPRDIDPLAVTGSPDGRWVWANVGGSWWAREVAP